jgi:hypothetical protein
MGVRLAAVVLVSGFCGLAPWAIRNQLVFGRPIFTTTHGGYTLLLSNNPRFYEHLRTAPAATVWKADQFKNSKDAGADEPAGAAPRVDQRSDELANDRRDYARAWQIMAAEPATFLRACLHRVRRLWGVLPYAIDPNEGRASRWLRYATALWYTLELALAAIGAWSLRGKLLRTPWLLGVVLAVGFTAVHLLYWTDLRMRAPLVPVVALAAAAGGGWIAAKCRAVND